MAMNTQKVVVGGIAAGVVIFALDFLSNTLFLGDRWREALDALNPTLYANLETTGAIVSYAVLDILFGIMLVWLYAAVRPKFGPGPRTATIVGVYFWILTGVMWAGLVVMGMFSWGMYVVGAITWLIISLAAANVGGMLYKEA